MRHPGLIRPQALGAAAALFVRTLPDHRLLDRVVRGRAWIPILGVLLAGIVAMQVEILKLSASTGRSLERVTALQSTNQQLRDTVAVLSDDQRIERLAAGMNMVMPGPTQVRFVSARGAAVGRALNSIHAPDSAAFLAALPSAQSTAAAATTGSPAPVLAAAGTAIVQPSPTATATGTAVAPASAASGTTTAGTTTPVTPTGPSATNTGVASPSSTGATSSSTGATAATTPAAPATASTTTPNGAASVPSGG